MGLIDDIKYGYFKLTNRQAKTEEAARDPKKTNVKKIGYPIANGTAGEFEDQVVDLDEILRAYDTDSYIKRAVDKHTDLVIKNGWDFSSRNEKASEYVWTRLKLMEEGTGTPTSSLIYQIVYDIVLYANAYVIKSRQRMNSSPVKSTGYTGKQPVAGYFSIPPQSVTIRRDETGNIVEYLQTIEGEEFSIKPEDMIHFAYKKPTGKAYGIPFIFNALDDVKMLRQIEDSVARLIHRNLFPLHLYTVGLPQAGFEATDEEIEDLREEIRNMPMDGALVVPERHKLEVVGSDSSSLDAEGYLKYFRQRVFTGLGMSDSVMGVGDTSNRSTSDNQSADLNDSVKEFQRVFTETFQLKIINELLFEGGFDPTLNEDDEVIFTFSEIDLDAKTKKENHIIQQFMQNAITHEEMRHKLGHDPVKDESRLYANLFGNKGSGYDTDSAAGSSKNENEPSNQHSEENKKDISVKEGLTSEKVRVNLVYELGIESYEKKITSYIETIKKDVLHFVRENKANKIDSLILETARRGLKDQLRKIASQTVYRALSDAEKEAGLKINNQQANLAKEKAEKSIDNLIDSIRDRIEKSQEQEDPLTFIHVGLEAQKYKAKVIAKTDLIRIYNYTKILSAKYSKKDKVYLEHLEGQTCHHSNQEELDIKEGQDLLSIMPPFHPCCNVIVSLNKKEEV